MNNLQKQQIAAKLTEYCARYESQNKAAKSLKGVSSATISQVLNNNWELIAAEMWRNIAAQIGYSPNQWQGCETTDYKLLSNFLTDAQNSSLVFAITGDAGTGKSFAMRNYTENNKCVYMLTCAEYWNKKHFLQELLKAMGRDYNGFTISEMMTTAISELKKQQAPLLILDEADKLTDQVLYFFITLYNQLEDNCGIVLCATSHLAKRLTRGLNLNKKGYNEIFSRIGRKCIELKGLSADDIAAICKANGIENSKQIEGIINECEGDLRRVKRMVHAAKRKKDS